MVFFSVSGFRWYEVIICCLNCFMLDVCKIGWSFFCFSKKFCSNGFLFFWKLDSIFNFLIVLRGRFCVLLIINKVWLFLVCKFCKYILSVCKIFVLLCFLVVRLNLVVIIFINFFGDNLGVMIWIVWILFLIFVNRLFVIVVLFVLILLVIIIKFFFCDKLYCK